MSTPKGSDLEYDRADLIEHYNQIRQRELIDAVLADINSEMARLDKLTEVAKKIGANIPIQILNTSSLTSLEDHEQGLAEIQKQVQVYQARIKNFFRTKVIEEKAGLQSLIEAASSAGAPCITAGAVVESISNNQVLAQSIRDQAGISAYVKRASKLLEAFDKDFPDHIVPVEIVGIADAIASATNDSNASLSFDLFEKALKNEMVQIRGIAREKENKIKRLEEIKIHKMIGIHVTNALEEMGYSVSDIEETCYVEAGEIYAQHHDYPGYAVRLTVDKNSSNKLKSESVRIVDGTATDKSNHELEDEAFDKHWCTKSQLGQLVKQLEDSGLETQFRVIDKNASRVSEVDQENMPEIVQRTSSYSKKLNKILHKHARTHKLKSRE